MTFSFESKLGVWDVLEYLAALTKLGATYI